MTVLPSSTDPSHLMARLNAALETRTRDEFVKWLAKDVRWGGEHPGGHECTNRDEASEHYATLLAAGTTLHISDARPGQSEGEVMATIAVRSSDQDDLPPEMGVRLRFRDELITEICILDGPAIVEVLYFEGCPHFDQLLPHLRDLIDSLGLDIPVELVEVDSHDEALALRFRGSPTVRVNGHDVDPAVGHDHEDHDASDDQSLFGLQCRIYSTPDGPSGTPWDPWIVAALTAENSGSHNS